MGNRPQDITSIEKITRIEKVKELILTGYSRSEIIRYCSVNYKVGDRATENYIAEVKEIIKSDFEKTFDKNAFKAEINARLEDLYKKNIDIDDYKEARAIIKDLRDLVGLDEAAKVEHNVTLPNLFEITIKMPEDE